MLVAEIDEHVDLLSHPVARLLRADVVEDEQRRSFCRLDDVIRLAVVHVVARPDFREQFRHDDEHTRYAVLRAPVHDRRRKVRLAAAVVSHEQNASCMVVLLQPRAKRLALLERFLRLP